MTTKIKVSSETKDYIKSMLKDAKRQLQLRYRAGHHFLAKIEGEDSHKAKAINHWKTQIEIYSNMLNYITQ
jgi:hypothetical protein